VDPSRSAIEGPNSCDLTRNSFQDLFEAPVQPLLCGTVKPFSAAAAADRLPPWQNSARLRQFAGTVGLLGLLYGVLAVIALLGGPRIGASFLPLPGGGPDPASPVAGLQPGRPTQNIPTIPHATTSPTPTPVVPPPPSTPLPTATIPGVTVAGQLRTPATPCPTATPGDPTPQLADEYNPTIPVATKTPPSRPTTTTTTSDPQRPPTSKPTDDPATPPPTTTPPSDPPSTSDDPPAPPDDPPPPPDGPSLGGLLGALLDKLGL
jgi:hypothetical protein